MSDGNFSSALPERPNVEQLMEEAESLLKQFRTGDEQTAALVNHYEGDLNAEKCELKDVQRVLAQSYGFPSWAGLKERVMLLAIKNGDVANLEKAMRSYSDIEKLLTTKISSDPRPTNHAIGKDMTLLQFASFRSWSGDDTSSVLRSHGAAVDIHSACGLGMVDRIEEILAANPNAINEQVDTYCPLQYAISSKQPNALRCLLEHGDDANRDLKKVAYFGWEDEAIELEYTPWKPIHMASVWGFDATRIPVAECLLQHGADLNAVSPLDGYRPLHLVAMPNRVDMIRFFVENGADVDCRSEKCQTIKLESEESGPTGDAFSNTPLMVTCAEGFTEAAQCLVDLGADVNARNDRGQTPLHLAACRFWDGQPYDSVIQILLSHGADKSARDADGNVPTL